MSVVATTAGGTTRDHATYLVPRGAADIFFPTDFGLLARLYCQAVQMATAEARDEAALAAEAQVEVQVPAASTHVSSTAEFMRRWSPVLGATATTSGYNPLLEDYTNTAVLVAHSPKATAAFRPPGPSPAAAGPPAQQQQQAARKLQQS